jgi:hypothetical protein
MVGLVVFAKVLAGAVKASLHGSHRSIERFGNFGVTAPLLHERQQRPVLRAELGERVAESVELLRVDGAGRFGNVFVFLPKGQEDPPQFLAAELVDAGVAREAKEPRLELRRRLEPVDRPHHFDENLLGQVLDVIAPVGHGVNKTRDPVLVGHDKLVLGVFVALLSPPNKVGQRGR